MTRKRGKIPKSNTSSGKRAIPLAKSRTWTTPTVLSLILTAIGAGTVIELKPQIAVTTQEAIKKSQPFSVPFRINNTGYLSFDVDHLFCYVNDVKSGTATMTGVTITYPDWEGVTLERGEGGTVFCNLLESRDPPEKADVVIVVDYKLSHGLALGPFRKYFRFKGAYVDYWQWTSAPAAEIAGSIDEHLDPFVKRLAQKRP